MTASKVGGSGEIRTHGGIATTPVFKTGALNHSATLPSIHPPIAGFTRAIHALAPSGPTCGRSGSFPTIQSRPVALNHSATLVQAANYRMRAAARIHHRRGDQAAVRCRVACLAAAALAHSSRPFLQPLLEASSRAGMRSARKSMNTRTAGSKPRREGNTA